MNSQSPTSKTTPEIGVAVTGLRGIPAIMGGVETHCEELLPRLHERDPLLAITVFGRSHYLPPGEQCFGAIRVVPLPASRRQSLEAIVSTFFGVVEAKRRGARIIHIHAIGPALLAPLARVLGMKVVVTHHGTDYDRAKWGLIARTSLRLGEWAAMRAAHRIICVAPSLTDTLGQRFSTSRDKLRYIPNGAPKAEPEPKETEGALDRFDLTSGKYVLAVGRLVPEKGFDYLIDAYRRSGIEQPLVIVGGADHASDASRRLLQQGDDRVRFLGLQPRVVVQQLYRGAGLFVLPSFHEGLPIVALEAARGGAPMLLSDIEPNRNVGLAAHNYFPVGEVDALAQALRAPFDRYRVDSSAVQRRFDWDTIADQTLQVYHDLR